MFRLRAHRELTAEDTGNRSMEGNGEQGVNDNEVSAKGESIMQWNLFIEIE